MSFSKTAWGAIEFTYKSILEHPFNKELAEGTLETEKFQFYICLLYTSPSPRDS